MPPGDGGRSDSSSRTPIPARIERARKEATAWAELRKDVEHLGEKVDSMTEAVKALSIASHPCAKEADLAAMSGRIDAQEERIDDQDSRFNWGRGLFVTVMLFLAGTVTTLLVTCNEQNERDAETRVMVKTNSTNISKLEKSIQSVNEGRQEDVRSIVRAVKSLESQAREESAEDWWEGLPTHQKRAIIRAVGEHAVPSNGDEGP